MGIGCGADVVVMYPSYNANFSLETGRGNNTYTVTYDANGGLSREVPMDAKNYEMA